MLSRSREVSEVREERSTTVCRVVDPYRINGTERLSQQLRKRSSIHGLHGSISFANRYSSKPRHPSLHALKVLQITFHVLPGNAYANCFMSSVWDKDSDPSGFEVSHKRIEPKRAEEVLHFLAEEERARLAAIVESSDDAIIGKTLEGTITSWNKGAERIYGYSAEEAAGEPISMLVPTERPDEVPEILQKIRRGEKVEHFETVRMTKDGRRLDISLTVSPIKDIEGSVVAASTIARDITDRKEAEKRLREAKGRYRTLVEQIPAITYVQEPLESSNPKAVTYVSPQYETILGYPPESQVIDEEHWLRTIHPEDRERGAASIHTTFYTPRSPTYIHKGEGYEICGHRAYALGGRRGA